MQFQVLGVTDSGMYLASDGGCRHIYYLIADFGLEKVILVGKVFYICQPFAIMGIATGRVSVAVLVLRLMGTSYWRRRFLWFIIFSTLFISMLNSILLFTACTPTAGLWDFTIAANCWNPVIMTDVTIFSSSKYSNSHFPIKQELANTIPGWNVFIDFCLPLISITIFWNLKLSLKKRVALCTLMSGGVLAGVCGAIKTSKLPETNAMDSTWATVSTAQFDFRDHRAS